MNNLIIVAYSNKENIHSLNYRMSLKKQGYNFKIVGNKETWINYLTKIKAYHKYVKKLMKNEKRLKGRKYDLVCLTDCHDVIACDSPENLISKYLTFNSDIVFSAEPICLKEKCIYLKDYWSDKKKGKLNENETENKFLNSGFIIGKINTIYEALQFVLDQEQFGITDDQLAYCMYATKYPKKISLDHTSKLCGTIGTNLMEYEVINNKIMYTKTKENPCFIHTPGNSSDFSYRLDYFGKKLYENDYLTDSVMNKLKNFKNYLKENKMLKIYGLIVIALLLFVVYHHPKIIMLYLLIISILLLILSF